VLRKIEELKVRNVTADSYRIQLDATIKLNLKDPKVDLASHFILRAAYCRTEDLRRWFLAQESLLFKHRIDNLQESALEVMLKQVELTKVSSKEKESLREQLLSVPGTTLGDFAALPYYKIPFVQAIDLVAQRACLIKKGQAYVPLPRVVSILAAKFRMSLSRSLVLAAAAFSTVEEEGRIAPLLKTMNSQMTSRPVDTVALGDTDVTAATIDSLASSMPLCMSQLHAGLKGDHKLKHWGRLQYGLFLKGAGMSMEDSLLFFQREFGKIMTTEEYNKQYAYGVRHMYGKEGKRATYTPYNCKKIIMGQGPGAGDHHGCPYRNYDDDHLSSLLSKLSVGSPQERGEILRLKQGHNYQLACLRHFEVMHPKATSVKDLDLDNVGNHPNAWFGASVNYHSKSKKTESKPTMSGPEKIMASASVSPEKPDY
jgi:DNA primase large subunit